MDDERSNRCGDDILPSQPGWASRRVRSSENARASLGSERSGCLPASDQHVRQLELDAYIGVIRAFTAQSGAFPWSKGRVMVMLRRELGISDKLHLGIVEHFNSNRTSSQFRGQDEQVAPMFVPGEEFRPGATTSGSRKKPKSTHVSQASLAHPISKSGLLTSTLSPASAGRQTELVGVSRSKKSRWGRQQQAVDSSLPSLPGSSAGEGLGSGLFSWVGKRVRKRWPDGAFYEAVITDYKPDMGRHTLRYEDGYLEWVNFKTLGPNDLQIVDDPPISASNKAPPPATANLTIGSQGGAGRGTGRRGVVLFSVRGGKSARKGPANVFRRSAPGLPSITETPEKSSDVKGMLLPSLSDLTKQVDGIADVDDGAQVMRLKTTAMEYEKYLRDQLAKVGEESSEEDEGKDPCLQRANSVGREGARSSSKDSKEQHENDGEHDTAGDREGDAEP